MTSTILTSSKERLTPKSFFLSFSKTQYFSTNESITEFHMYSGVVGLLSYRESSNSFSVGHHRLQMEMEKQDPRSQARVDFGSLCFLFCFFFRGRGLGRSSELKEKKIKTTTKDVQTKTTSDYNKIHCTSVLLNLFPLCVTVTQP